MVYPNPFKYESNEDDLEWEGPEQEKRAFHIFDKWFL